jgi:hypothetical protein
MYVCAPPARAQFTSVLEGTITDPSDAVIPNAKVEVENIDTGTTRTIETTASGYYRVGSLPPGNFTLRVSAEGFQTSVQENIVLQGTQVKTLNLQLQVGQAATTVSVAASHRAAASRMRKPAATSSRRSTASTSTPTASAPSPTASWSTRPR